MPTQIKEPSPPLWALNEWRIRNRIGRCFMYLTKWLAIAACRCIDITVKVAPWLDKSRDCSLEKKSPGLHDGA
jgi:hypothetical protein